MEVTPEGKAATARRGGEGGFTLLEMLIAMVVVSVMLMAATQIYMNGIQLAIANSSQSQANARARIAVAQIDKDIKQAKAVLETTVLNGNTYQSGNQVLVLQIPSWDGDQTKTIPNTYDTVIYQWSKTGNAYNIWKIVTPGTDGTTTSSRAASSQWVFPYDATVTGQNQKKSQPWVQAGSDASSQSSETCFKYYVQDSGTGTLRLKTASDGWDDVILVETKMTIWSGYNNQPISTVINARSRMRNWSPSS